MNIFKRFKVSIVEVGPRDGLQNEKKAIDKSAKHEFIQKLRESGMKHIEVGAFVSPKWVPQMASSEELISKLISEDPKFDYSALVPNEKGMVSAIKTGIKHIAVFTSVSETFSEKNTNCSLAESLNKISIVIKHAKQNDIKVRSYISCVVGCPYEGKQDPSKVTELTEKLLSMGSYQVSLGDTIGIATSQDIQTLLKTVTTSVKNSENLAVHFHDTYGQGLANVLASLDYGIQWVDSSVNGLGGCPYAPGATGNVATEEVVYMLSGLKMLKDEIDLGKLIDAGKFISTQIGRPTSSDSKLTRALLSKKKKIK